MQAWCAIGDLNNRPDSNGRGCVPYAYDVATCQLTNEEWVGFLNAVGQECVRRLQLYHKDMSSGILGGVMFDHRLQLYYPKDGWANKPIVYVTYTSLCRYCNWLATGGVECGCYDFSGFSPRRINGAKFFLLTDDEWYKAAYYAHGCYLNYPTGDDLPQLDQANFELGDALSKGPPYYLADVDDYKDYPSPWGVVQMGGNVWEYLETVSHRKTGPVNLLRGGSFGYTETGLSKTNLDIGKYDGRCYVFGARIGRCENGWHPRRKPLHYGVARKIGQFCDALRGLRGYF